MIRGSGVSGSGRARPKRRQPRAPLSGGGGIAGVVQNRRSGASTRRLTTTAQGRSIAPVHSTRQQAVRQAASQFVDKHVAFDQHGTPTGFKTSPQQARMDFTRLRTKLLTEGTLRPQKGPKLRTAVKQENQSRAIRSNVGQQAARRQQAVSHETEALPWLQSPTRAPIPAPKSVARSLSQHVLPARTSAKHRAAPPTGVQGPVTEGDAQAQGVIARAAQKSHTLPQFRSNVRQMAFEKVKKRTAVPGHPRGNMESLWKLTYLSGKPAAYRRSIKAIGRMSPETWASYAKQGNGFLIPKIPKKVARADLQKRLKVNPLATRQAPLTTQRVRVNAGMRAAMKALPGYEAAQAWNQDDLGRAIDFALLTVPGVGELKAGGKLAWTAKLGLLGARKGETAIRALGDIATKGGLKAAFKGASRAPFAFGKQVATHPVQSFNALGPLGQAKVVAAGASPAVPQVRKIYGAGFQAAKHPQTWETTARTPLALVAGPATLGVGLLGSAKRGAETPLHDLTGLGRSYSGKEIAQPTAGAADLFYQSSKDFIHTLVTGSQHDIEQTLQKEWGLVPLATPFLASGALLRPALRGGRSALRGFVESHRGGVRPLYRPSEEEFTYHVADRAQRDQIAKGKVQIRGEHQEPISAQEAYVAQKERHPQKAEPDVWAIDKKTGERHLMPPATLHAYAAAFGRAEAPVDLFARHTAVRRRVANITSRYLNVPHSIFARELAQFQKDIAGHILPKLPGLSRVTGRGIKGRRGQLRNRQGFEIAPGVRIGNEDVVGYLFREGVKGESRSQGLSQIRHRLQILGQHEAPELGLGKASFDYQVLSWIEKNPQLLTRAQSPALWRVIDRARHIDKIVHEQNAANFVNRHASIMEAGGIEPAANRVHPEVRKELGVTTREEALQALSDLRAKRDAAKLQQRDIEKQHQVAPRAKPRRKSGELSIEKGTIGPKRGGTRRRTRHQVKDKKGKVIKNFTTRKGAEQWVAKQEEVVIGPTSKQGLKQRRGPARGQVTRLQNKIDKVAPHLEVTQLTDKEKAYVNDALHEDHAAAGQPPPTKTELAEAEQRFAQNKKAYADAKSNSELHKEMVQETQDYMNKHGYITPGMVEPPQPAIQPGVSFQQLHPSGTKEAPVGAQEMSPSAVGTLAPTMQNLIQGWHNTNHRTFMATAMHHFDEEFRGLYSIDAKYKGLFTEDELIRLDTESGKRPQGGALTDAKMVKVPERFVQDPGAPVFKDALNALEKAEIKGQRSRLKGKNLGGEFEAALQTAINKLEKQGKGERYALYPKAAFDELTGQLARADQTSRFLRALGKAPSTLILSTSFAWLISQPIAEGLTLALTTSPRDWVPAAKRIYDIYRHGSYEERMHLSVLSDAVVGHHLLPQDYQRWVADDRPVRNTPGWGLVTEFSHFATLRPRFPGVFDRWKGNLIRDAGTAAEMRKVSRRADRFGRSVSGTYDQMHYIADNLKGKDFQEQLAWINAHPKAAATMEKRLDDMLGNWNALTVNERTWAPLTLFYPFLRFSLDWTFRTFPARHPIKASVAALLGQISSEQINEATKNHPAFFQQLVDIPYFGSGPGKPTGIIPATRFIPGGNFLTQAAGASDLQGLSSLFAGAINPAIGIPFMTLIAGRGSFGQSLEGIERPQAFAQEMLQMSPLTQFAGQYGLSKAPGLDFLKESPAQKLGRAVQGGEEDYWIRRGVLPFKPFTPNQFSQYAILQRAQAGAYKNLPQKGQFGPKGQKTGEVFTGQGFPQEARAKRKEIQAQHKEFESAARIKDFWKSKLKTFYKQYGIKPEFPIRVGKGHQGFTGEAAKGYGKTKPPFGAGPNAGGYFSGQPAFGGATKGAQPDQGASPPKAKKPAKLSADATRAGLDPAKAAALKVASKASGVPVEVLASIGHIETTNGTSDLPGVHKGTNSSGAAGPFQFLQSSWEPVAQQLWGKNADKHSVYNYADAALGAGQYLKNAGWKTGDPKAQHDAIFSYNHADWYVDEVMQGAQRLQGGIRGGKVVARVPSGRYAHPFPQQFWTESRADQGKDFVPKTGDAPILALGDATVMGKGQAASWASGGGGGVGDGIVYKLKNAKGLPSPYIFVYEGVLTDKNLKAGSKIKKGQVIGRAAGTGSSLEMGFASGPDGHVLTPYNGAADGTAMPAGIAMEKLLDGLRGGKKAIKVPNIDALSFTGGAFGSDGGGPMSFSGGSSGMGAAMPSPQQDPQAMLALIRNRFTPGIFAQFASGALSAQQQGSPFGGFAPFAGTSSAFGPNASAFAQDALGTSQEAPALTGPGADLVGTSPAALFANFAESRRKRRRTQTS